jgi:hypothetical protein
MVLIQRKCRTLSRSEVIVLTNYLARPASGRNAQRNCSLRLYRLIATMDAKAPLPALADQEPTWASASNLERTWGLNQLADRLHEKAQLP